MLAATAALLLTPVQAAMAGHTQAGAASEALAHYLSRTGQPDPLGESSTVAVDIQASLPSLQKSGHLSAIRHPGAEQVSSAPKYDVLRIEGDATVKQQVIARYLSAEKQASSAQSSSVAITPANYKFRYIATVEEGGSRSYVFDLTPKKKRSGLMKGQLWIDAATGVAVQQDGYLVKSPSVFIRRIEIARTTDLNGGTPSRRVTHVSIESRLFGKAELTITESPFSGTASKALALNTRPGEAE